MSQQPGFVLPTSQGSTQPLNRSREHSDASLYQPQPLRQPKLRPLYASEEQPGLEVVHAPTRGGGRAQSISEKAKSIWSGWSGYSRDPSEYTFYREPTPTPEESYEREKCDASIPAARRPGRSSTIALETAASIAPPPRRPKQDVICGIRRRLFTGILVALVLLIVGIVLGVGLGVGLGKHDQRETKDPGPVSSSSAPIPTSSTGPSITPSITSAAAPHSSTSTAVPTTTPTASPTTDCPFVNNTIYQVPGSSIKFLRLCGIDYSENEATDLTHIPTSSFAGCMDNCAGTYGCIGASWGVLAGDSGSEHQCWMKSKLKIGHKVVNDWCFGVLQQ
ncbi:hypothetical protein DL546_004764 [Coniochaeta pulveracea]|uniref:Apple domain-containing protein n=1 Tax=Coniochaeta pulveracea TaxID=177199 RepID=A0A420Y424_9PEZI|nr:hypothetical protein DL546_004764 [Coniochaeta pulveracea]